MPGTPATTPRHGAPRYANTDAADFATQANAVTDRFDITAMRLDTGLASARPTAGITDRWYYATDTKQLSRDTGSAWENALPNAHASSHQDGAADPLTVREAMMDVGAAGLAKGAFSAYRNGVQTINTGDRISFNAELFDVSSWYDATTNFRYTPQVAGVYLLTAMVRANSALTADTFMETTLRKNGADFHVFQPSSQRATAQISSGGTAIVQANGTTDYFDVIVRQNNGAGTGIAGIAPHTYFMGHLVGRS
jgi:hypothetical protein